VAGAPAALRAAAVADRATTGLTSAGRPRRVCGFRRHRDQSEFAARVVIESIIRTTQLAQRGVPMG
jgi:hypothetical protein